MSQEQLSLEPTSKAKRFKLTETIFLAGVAGTSILVGFGAAIAAAKKKDPEYFGKGLVPGEKMQSGASLALRALGWGTFYAFTGCGILFYSVWKLMGVQNLEEFRMKVGSMLPRIPKNEVPQGRTEFDSLTDFMQYLIDEDNKAKEIKANENNPTN